MAWTYDNTDLNTTSSSGRLNSVRLLVGDTDSTDEQVQDEEITFALAQVGDNVYYAASWIANVLASKYSRRVTTELDGALRADYSDLANQYRKLASQLRQDATRFSGTALGVEAGGIRIAEINTARQDETRVQSNFRMDRFDNPQAQTDARLYSYDDDA